MLSLIKLADAEYPLAQVALGIEEYYLGVGEAPGVWAGRWAEELGLAGVVEAGQLRSVVNAIDPRDGRWWLEGRPARKVNAFDATFSPPKSASLLWAFGTAETASVVSRAHVEAVSQALAFLEDQAAVSRQQTGGVRTRVDTHGFGIATFVHRTSRAGDPQLHTHCIIPNVVCRADGSYASVDGAAVYRWAKAAGSIYQEQLRRILTVDLGVEWGPDRNGCREMVGFTAEQLRAFSKRSTEIEKYLERNGGVYRTAAARMRADHEASLATRTPKNLEFTPERLKACWTEEAATVGLGEADQVEALVVGRAGPRQPLAWEDVVDALTDPETGLCAHDSRFGEAQVVEAVAALGAGRLTVDEIRTLSRDFLASDHVVRLTPDREAARRSPPRWTTTEQLALEDRVVGNLDRLVGRPVTGLDPTAVEAAINAESVGLGHDQAAAVPVLCGPGPSLRSLIAPPGYGKTTLVHAGAAAAVACGRPVLGVATTNRAVAELRDVGIEAVTIARLAIDLADRALAPDTIVILDEISQTSTVDAEVVLAAVREAPGAQLWCLGDVRQAQSVRPGGLAAELDRLGAEGRIPAPVLLENRRQTSTAERLALAAYRAGDLVGSQAIRTDAGLEHEHATPVATREAMADAMAVDVGARGPAGVVAMAVSHADCEDMADRVRARLAAAGLLAGPELEGPGWGTEPRSYRAGDRVLLHARIGTGDQRLHNGTTLTVTAITGDGLIVATDAGHAFPLPSAFVAGRQRDGRPNLSHGWCRTVDGAQGGSWDHVHLLGSAALDNFTGYVGQSRARAATHTWNVARLPDGDWGGRLADDRSAADQVLDAVGRSPLKTFAANDNPYLLDRELSAQIFAHQAVLAGCPPDLSAQLAHALDERARAERAVATWSHQIDYDLALARVGPLAVLRRERREERDVSRAAAARHRGELLAAQQSADHWTAEVARLTVIRDVRRDFQQREGWRAEQIGSLQERLEQHWADAVLAVTNQDDPLAFGIDRLRDAHRHYARALHRIDAGLPPDRSDELTRANRDLAHHQANHAHALKQQTTAERQLAAASTRRLGMRDKPAISKARAELATATRDAGRTSELVANAHALVKAEEAAVAERGRAESLIAEERTAMRQGVHSLNDALATTRPERVLQAARDPLGRHLGHLLGTPPAEPAGQAAWCGLAQRIEAALDHPDASRLSWSHDHLDMLVRGLVATHPASIDRAQAIISAVAAVGDADFGRHTELSGQPVWDAAARTGDEAVRLAEQARAPEIDHGIDIGM